MTEREQQACYTRAMCVLDDENATETQIAEAVDTLAKLAQEGYCDAAVTLGERYELGEECEQDFEQAVRWYTVAADLGDSGVYNKLGQLHRLLGNGGEATRWLTEAVEADPECGEAMYGLGLLSRDAIGVPQSDAEALGWFLRGSRESDADALYALSQFLREGRGTAANPADADTLQHCAAFAGSPEAVFAEAMKAFAVGEAERALRQLKQAAILGEHADAQYKLAQIYHEGQYGEKDLKRAIDLYLRAADQQHEAAAEVLRQLAADDLLTDCGMQPLEDLLEDADLAPESDGSVDAAFIDLCDAVARIMRRLSDEAGLD